MSDLISREDVLKIALEYTWGGAKVLRQRISALPAVQPDAAEQAIRDAMTVGMGVVRIAPEDFFKTAETRPDAAILEAACIAAHNAYEAAAHEAGWITNTQSRKPWVEVPEANKIAMRAGIGAAIALIDNPGEEVMPSEARPNRAAHDTAPAGLSAGGGA